jgi:hypothetical protein
MNVEGKLGDFLRLNERQLRNPAVFPAHAVNEEVLPDPVRFHGATTGGLGEVVAGDRRFNRFAPLDRKSQLGLIPGNITWLDRLLESPE